MVGVILPGCGGRASFPEQGFLTRAIMGWDEDGASQAARRIDDPDVRGRDLKCENVAVVRVSDAAQDPGESFSADELKHMHDLIYSDCISHS